MLISYVLYYISTPLPAHSKEGIPIKPNRIQERLFAELSSLGKGTDGQGYQQNFQDIDSLPYLEAVIKEGLRLRGSFPSLLLRVIPPGKALSIQGYWVPEGTELGVQPWSMHRKRTVWDKPYEFIPERWLPSDLGGWGPEPGTDSFNEMNRHFIPFGLGTRACAGKNMGMMVTKLIISSLVLQFYVKADEKELDAKKMEPRDTHVVSIFSFQDTYSTDELAMVGKVYVPEVRGM
jgi:cytochrome P450